LDERVGLVATALADGPDNAGRVRERDPWRSGARRTNRIVADGQASSARGPTCPLLLKANFQAHVERKLYVHNLGHADAPGGVPPRTRPDRDAIAVPSSRCDRAAMEASAEACACATPTIRRRRPGTNTWTTFSGRLANRAVGDTVFRVGRDLARKLSPATGSPGRCASWSRPGRPWPVCDATPALRFAATDEKVGRSRRRGRAHAGRAPRRALPRSPRGLERPRFRAELARIARRYAL
jgi:hypothetical protein